MDIALNNKLKNNVILNVSSYLDYNLVGLVCVKSSSDALRVIYFITLLSVISNSLQVHRYLPVGSWTSCWTCWFLAMSVSLSLFFFDARPFSLLFSSSTLAAKLSAMQATTTTKAKRHLTFMLAMAVRNQFLN